MNGAIFYSGQYGSTAQYAAWIGEETGLPVFDIIADSADPADFDFVVLGSSVIIYKLTIREWVKTHLPSLENRPVIVFSVSGAGAGPKLDKWVANSLPKPLLRRVEHVALKGRQRRGDLRWWTRAILWVGAQFNDDPKAARGELKGFDYVDKASIEPIVNMIKILQSQPATGRA